MTASLPHSGLARRVGTAGAVIIGLGSMLGAGVFSAFAPAAAASGSWLLISLAIAGVVAWCNALASAQLAAQFPSAGGTYVYGRELLGPWWGFFAGWSFIVGKTASCAAMALVIAAYTVPEPAERWVAAGVVLSLAIVNSLGVTRTVAVATVLVSMTLLTLAIVIGAGATAAPATAAEAAAEAASTPGAFGILQGAGIMFFAFAGYARVATLGEEVRDPARTIPRAISIALAIVLALYVAVALVSLHALGPSALAVANEPLAEVVRASGWSWAVPLVMIGAATASLGALLALIAGVGRTTLAMARDRELAGVFARVHPRFHVPHVAELSVGVLVAGVVLLVDLRGAIAFSSFGVLLYYFVANLAAWRQSGAHRRFPRALHLLGVLGCLALAVTLPWQGVVAGVVVVLIGMVVRLIRQARERAARARRARHPA